MLIALVVLAVLNLLLSIVMFCCLRVLWARMPEPVVQNCTVGGFASMEQVRDALHRNQNYSAEGPDFFGAVRGKQVHRPEPPPAEPEPA